MKKYILFPLLLLLSFSISSLASADDMTGNTHEQGLRYLMIKKALVADDQGNIYPNQIVTRAEFAHYLSQVMNLPVDNSKSFSDVPASFPYYQSIQKAAAAGIITGYLDNTFRPDAPITRVHMAVMIERSLQYMNKSISSPKASVFADSHQIGKNSTHAVNVGVELDIIHGSKKGNATYFFPYNNATRGHAASFIYRMMEHAGDPATNLPLYEVKEIKNNQLVATGRSAYSYEGAFSLVTNQKTQFVTIGDKIYYMPAGLGYAVSNKYIALYSETIKDPMAVAANTEMQFISTDGRTARVNLSGHVGTVSVNDVTLIPFATSKGRSYYRNENGELMHYLVNQTTGAITGSYTSGKAPAGMLANTKYFSWDGIYFLQGSQSIEYYNYYQFLPIISKTQYTAAEIDRYIAYALAQREKISSKYANATTQSKLIGLGPILKKMEEQYGINAMMILSLAIHESDFGMSNHAQTYNNLFGLYVYDTNPLNMEFASVEANILEYVQEFLWKKYIPATAPFANGAVFGTKRLGMNVRYASDPHWGAKAAGHYYRADRYLGSKDAKNAYTIGMTTTAGLNIRSGPTVNQPILYRYTRTSLPLLIKRSANSEWYEIYGESPGLPPAYVHKAYVKVLQTTK